MTDNSKKKILIVDDEESICQTLGGILKDEGHEVITAVSGEDALRVVDEDPPNLVLLDIWLPGIDGIEVLKAIKAGHPQIQVCGRLCGQPQPQLPHQLCSGHKSVSLCLLRAYRARVQVAGVIVRNHVVHQRDERGKLG